MISSGVWIMNGKFEEAIQKAMKELHISYKKAMGELVVYMCGHGTVEDFKDFINYYIQNQERMWKD